MERVELLRSSDTFGAWVTRLDVAIAADLAGYRNRLADAASSGYRPELLAPLAPHPKAIKDALWGMVDVSPRELVVLDSPLLQRLRRVRQLGVSYLTYPTAGYSRFEHAIGAMHQAERMIRAIIARSDLSLRATLEHALGAVRLAALLHDIGHLPMSHLTERYYHERECASDFLVGEVENARGDVVEILRCESVSLSEVLSLATVLAPSTWSLLSEAGYTDTEIQLAAFAIVATAATASTAFVPNIISNVIDADKLDYLFRDAHATRIPLAVDLERLLYKLKVVSIPSSDLPAALTRTVPAGSSAVLLATDPAGNALIGDLLRARSMMFQRVYLHHKTRAAERLALDILEARALHPIDLVRLDDSVFEPASLRDDCADDVKLGVMALAERDLPRRAYAVAYRFLLGAAPRNALGEIELPQQVTDGVDALREALSVAAPRSDLLSAIIGRRQHMLSLLPGSRATEGKLWLEPEPSSFDIDDPDMHIERPDGTHTRAGGFDAKGAAFTQERLATTFLFARGNDASIQVSAVAAELEISSRFQLNFGRDAFDHAKVDLAAINAVKRALEAAEPTIYHEHGALRPPSWVARTEEVQSKLRELSGRWTTFNVPDLSGGMTTQHITRFLDQFPERLVSGMVAALDSLSFVTRNDLGRRFMESIAADYDSLSAVVAAPLSGDPTASAMALPYLFADTTHRPQVAAGVPQALAAIASGKASQLVIFDDWTLSGKQAATVIQTWFGVEPELPEESSLTNRLNDEDAALLRGANPSFRFVYAAADGIAELERVLAMPGVELTGTVDSLLGDSDVPKIAERASNSELADFLREVGGSVLQSTRGVEAPDKWTPDLIAKRSLGYGGSGLLLASYYNVPTGTVTALWQRGQYRRTEWLPLFPRRRR